MGRKKAKPSQEQLLETLGDLLYDTPARKKNARSFRGKQAEVIDQILSGRDVLAIMPTATGKSFCYQVPAMHLPGITLVISPLLALMEDQVKKLRKTEEKIKKRYAKNGQTGVLPAEKNFSAACLSSAFIADDEGFHYKDEKSQKGQTGESESGSFRKRRDKIFQDALEGKYKFLYITPERLRTGPFIRFAQRANISLIAVDEAHCVSLWGYEFRPRYLEIGRFIRRLDKRPIIAAFTATATKSVREDIVKLLDLKTDEPIDSGGEGRKNLSFSVSHIPEKPTAEEETAIKNRRLLSYLRRHKDECGIIYCSKVSIVNEVYEYLVRHDIAAVPYYAGLDRKSKKRSFADFEKGRKRVIVATTALGMGIDKSDIRFVIHYNMPLCLENYYQEAGRAGRDGKPAKCILYYSESDVGVCRQLIEGSLSESELSEKDREILQKVAYLRLSYMRNRYARPGNPSNSTALQDIILQYFREFDPYKTHAIEELLKQRNIHKEDLDVLTGLKDVDVLYVNRTKVAQELRKGHMSGENLIVGRMPEKENRQTPADRQKARGNMPKVSYRVSGETLSYFDLMVADAVYTLMSHRVPVIYPKQVMELLSGRKNLPLRPERTEEVKESLRKMMRAQIVIDRSRSLRYGFTYEEKWAKAVLQGPFLPLYEKQNGFGYDKETLPPLYEYAEILNGQFFSFPLRYLAVEDLYTSAESLAMTHYLLCRIHMMTAPHQARGYRAVTSCTVRFESLLETLRLELPETGTWYINRRKAALWDKKMLPILQHFKDTGVIADFLPDTESQSIKVKRFRLPEK